MREKAGQEVEVCSDGDIRDLEQSRCSVRKVMAPNNVYTLIPGKYEYGTCYCKKDFANVSKVSGESMLDHPGEP